MVVANILQDTSTPQHPQRHALVSAAVMVLEHLRDVLQKGMQHGHDSSLELWLTLELLEGQHGLLDGDVVEHGLLGEADLRQSLA